jgi:hypothetical protein
MKELTSRRHFLCSSVTTAAAYYVFSAIFTGDALPCQLEPSMHNWLKKLNELCKDLKTHEISPLQWQSSIDELYKRHSLQEILHFIDFEKLVNGIRYPSNMAAIRNVVFPRVSGLPSPLNFGHKIFALRKGGAIVPHVHNNMVSSHLILKGKFHVRTFDRIFDSEEPNKFISLRPSIDAHLGSSQLVTMSDDKDNGHWLVAESDTAFTLDIPVSNLNFRESYPSSAGDYGMIFIDPLLAEIRNGNMRTPIISTELAFSKYG